MTGVGGVGKTSIATAVAHKMLDTFDEVWLVELAPISDSGTVASALSKSVGISGSPSELDEIVAALSRRGRTLIVLDNCEHVVDAAADAAEALSTIVNVIVLTTSRVELGIGVEHLLQLAPLEVTEPSSELFLREAVGAIRASQLANVTG